MAGKKTSTEAAATTQETEPATEVTTTQETAPVVLQDFKGLVPSPRTGDGWMDSYKSILDAEAAKKLKQHALETDEFAVRKFEPGQAVIAQLVGLEKKVLYEGTRKQRLSFIGVMRDLEAGGTFRMWISPWLLEEFYKKGIHETGQPLVLTYAGRKASKVEENQDFHAWNRKYLSPEDCVVLFTSKSN